MSHNKGLCSKCGQDWQSHTLKTGAGGFSRECNRDPDLGIDVCMQVFWGKLQEIEDLKARVAKLIEDMEKLKSNHAIELAAKQKLLDEQMIDLQSARAKADDVDRILQVQLGHARSAMEAAHKAAIQTMTEAHEAAIATLEKSKDKAMEITCSGMQAAYDELENRYNANVTLLRGTEANVQARIAEIAQLEAQLSAQRTSHAEELAGADRRYRELDERFAEALRSIAKAETERDAALADKAKAERHARAAEGEESIAKDELRTMRVELNKFRAMAQQPGQAEIYRLSEQNKWYAKTYGPVPTDVDKLIDVGLPVVPETEPAPLTVAEAPKDDSVVQQVAEASVSAPSAAPAEPPVEAPSTNVVDDAQIVDEAAANGHSPVEATASAIELSMNGSHIIRGIDEIFAELGEPADAAGTGEPADVAGADETMECESPDGCTNVVTQVAVLTSPAGGRLKVHACDTCAADPAAFVPGLIEHGFEIDEDKLRELFVQSGNDLFIPPDPATFDAPQEVSNA